MAFTRSTINTNIVRSLADQPLETAVQLKTKFDEYAENDKAFTNNVLIAELEKTTAGSSAAENLGSRTITGVSGNTVWAQLQSLYNQLVAVVLGQIPDNSLTNAKLANDIKVGSLASLVTAEKGSVVGAINEVAAGGGSGSSLKDANDVFLISPVATVADAVNYIEVANAATGTAPKFEAKGSDAGIDLSLSAKGAGSVKTLTQPVTATCLRNITISTSAASGGTDGDIWIQYTP